MRKLICYGGSIAFNLIYFVFFASAGGQEGIAARFDMVALTYSLGVGLLIGGVLEMLFMLCAWKQTPCAQHRPCLRWTLLGLYYECADCRQRWLTRRSWRVLRPLAALALWFCAVMSVYGINRLAGTPLTGKTYITVFLTVLSLGCPAMFALVNCLAWRRLKDAPPEEHMGLEMLLPGVREVMAGKVMTNPNDGERADVSHRR